MGGGLFRTRQEKTGHAHSLLLGKLGHSDAVPLHDLAEHDVFVADAKRYFGCFTMRR
jgi:hypothetical protein